MDQNARNKEIRTFLLAAVVCVVFFICSLFFIFVLQNKNEEDSLGYIANNTTKEQAALNQHIDGSFQILQGVATSLAILDVVSDDQVLSLLDQINKQNSFVRLGILSTDGVGDFVDLDGSVYYDVNLSGQPFFEKAVRGENALSKTVPSIVTLESVNYYAVPIVQNNEIVAVLCGTDRSERISSLLSVSVFHSSGFFTILDSTGTTVVSTYDMTPESSEFLDKLNYGVHFESIAHFDSEKRNAFYEALRSNKTVQTQATINSDIDQILVEPLAFNNWSLVSAVPNSAIDAYYNTTAIGTTLIVVTACLIFILLIWHQRRTMLRNQKFLENLAYVDQLTGMRNFEKFKLDAQKMLDENPTKNFSIWSLDIKQFKNYNDIFGYAEGDELLKSIGRLFSEQSHKDAVYCRESSDNFACVRPYETKDELVAWFDSFVEALDNAKLTSSHEMRICVATGIYCPSDFDERLTITDMVNRAVMAKRKAKDIGGSSYEFFTTEMSEVVRRESEIAAAGKLALESRGITFYLQPKVGIQNGTCIVGAEALARWLHAEHGWISPADFVPVFEKEGMITQLDRYMFEEVCIWYRDYLDKGLPPINLAINVSLINVLQDDFIEYYVSTRAKHGLKDAQLEVELTESVIADDYELLLNVVEQLQIEGFNCSIDDFGSGYSSLNVLKNLPVNTLKLDTVFFHGAEDVEREKAVVEGLIKMAKEINIITVAEGVEESDQVDFLRSVGCDIVQGYVFSKPLPADAFEALMNRTGGNLD